MISLCLLCHIYHCLDHLAMLIIDWACERFFLEYIMQQNFEYICIFIIWTTGKVSHTFYLFFCLFFCHTNLPHDSCCMLFPPLFESDVTEKWLAIQWGNLIQSSFNLLIGVFCSLIQHLSLHHICCSVQEVLVQVRWYWIQVWKAHFCYRIKKEIERSWLFFSQF